MMTFEEFCAIVRDAIQKGVIKLSPPIELSELDLAIQFAIGCEMETTKRDTFTIEEIYHLVGKWCGQDVLERVFSEASDGSD